MNSPLRSSSMIRRFWVNVVAPVLLAALLLRPSQLPAQTNGIWGNTSPTGNWSDAINWQSGNVADGTGGTADFSQQTMTNSVLVHLDAPRSISGLTFGDLGNTYNWSLDNNGSSSNILTLANPLATPVISTVQPAISVNNGTATISAVITGSEGLVVNPSGGNGTLVLTGANTFYDGPSQSNAPNGGYGAITIDGGTLSIASDAPVGTRFFATPSPLGYLPTGNAPFPVSGASFIPADIVLSGGTLQATASFQLNSFRGVALGSAAGGGGGSHLRHGRECFDLRHRQRHGRQRHHFRLQHRQQLDADRRRHDASHQQQHLHRRDQRQRRGLHPDGRHRQRHLAVFQRVGCFERDISAQRFQPKHRLAGRRGQRHQ